MNEARVVGVCGLRSLGQREVETMKGGGPVAFTVSMPGGSPLAYGVMLGAIPNGVWIRANSPLAVGVKVLFRCLTSDSSSMTERAGEVVWVGEEQRLRAQGSGHSRQLVGCEEGCRAWVRLCEPEGAVALETSAA